MSNKIPSSIADLQEFITNKISEGKTVDYKISLPGNSDEDKKEFLNDVSSFANTVGGILIYGMDEEQGIASELKGIEVSNIESEVLRLENILRDGISPRIINISILPLQITDNTYAIRIYIPQSILSPHMVTFKGSSRFYARNSAGKYQLDVQEIRQSFLLSDSTTEKMKRFKNERIAKIISGDTPIQVGQNSKMAIHCIPISSYGINQPIDLRSASQNQSHFFSEQRFRSRYNLDGLLLSLELGDTSLFVEYLQVFRNCEIEYVNGYLVNTGLDGNRKEHIQIWDIETDVIKISHSVMNYQKTLGAEPPFFIFISFLDVKGLKMDTQSTFYVQAAYHNHGIDRDNIFLPEIVAESLPEDLYATAKLLKPAFDALWNSAGWPQSMYYDKDGNRLARQ